MDYKRTSDTIYTHFWGITDNIYGFGRLFAPSFFTSPSIFLPVHNGFYPSKWRVDGSLHKAMFTDYIAKRNVLFYVTAHQKYKKHSFHK